MSAPDSSDSVQAGKSTEELESKLNTAINEASGLMNVALGVQVGLFDVMARMDQPATSQQIADAGSFKERYVREWLGGMVAYGIVTLHQDGQRYSLPTNHRKVLAGPDVVMPFFATCVAGNGQSFYQLVECFKKDGPLGIDCSVPGVNESVAVLNQRTYTWQFLQEVFLPKVPGLIEKLDSGIEVVEIGSFECGLLLKLAQHYPKSRFVATDIDPKALKAGEQKAKEGGLVNMDFKVCDIYEIPDDMRERFDYLIMTEVLHDLPYIDKALKNMVSMLKPGGYMSIADVDGSSNITERVKEPTATMYFYFSLFRCLPLSLNYPGSDGAGAAWGKEATRAAIQEAGLEIVDEDEAPESNRHYICLRK